MKLKERFTRFLKNKYRFIIYNDTNYKQIWSSRLSGWFALGVIVPLVLLFIFLIFAIIAYTPVRNLIPGYPDSKMRRNIIYNAEKIDSLENIVASWEKYFDCIQTFATGEKNATTTAYNSLDTITSTETLGYKLSPEDSIFRVEMEMEERARLTTKQEQKKSIFENAYLYPPLKGKITKSFDPIKKYLGIDIETQSNAIVSATMDGSIISAAWTLSDGYVIEIQHSNNLVSIYKGNSSLLKTAGDRVSAGQAIATIGDKNSDSKASLHFELWLNGTPIDPTTYIVF